MADILVIVSFLWLQSCQHSCEISCIEYSCEWSDKIIIFTATLTERHLHGETKDYINKPDLIISLPQIGLQATPCGAQSDTIPGQSPTTAQLQLFSNLNQQRKDLEPLDAFPC